LKIAHVDGYKIIVSTDEDTGVYIYFPTGCTINPSLLSFLNLYRDKEINSNPDKSGFFEKNGRVKTIKLRGEYSEGFILPFNCLKGYVLSNLNLELHIPDAGTEFDELEHNGKTLWICKKYVNKTYLHPYDRRRERTKPKFNKVINTQFKFHYDTVILKKCPEVIQPFDFIHISEKVHGTSGISALVLCKQQLNWKQKIAKFLTGEEFNKYDYVYSSRNVINNTKAVYIEADSVIKPYLIPGMTIYYEIVGYEPNGRYIQEEYDYGCIPPTKTGEIDGKDVIEYNEGVNFKIYIYRITLTNIYGDVHEFSPREVRQWCINNNLRCVKELYYGKASALYPELNIYDNWNEKFLEKLSNDSERFYMEQDSPSCMNTVPNEGIVIKIDNLKSEAFKIKCFKFLNKEQVQLDKGVVNIEDDQ